jgi:hypothetical protein
MLTPEMIRSFWYSKIDESDVSVDYAEALERCWICTKETNLKIIKLEKDGQDNDPANHVLLCNKKHWTAKWASAPIVIGWLKYNKRVAYLDSTLPLDAPENIFASNRAASFLALLQSLSSPIEGFRKAAEQQTIANRAALQIDNDKIVDVFGNPV